MLTGVRPVGRDMRVAKGVTVGIVVLAALATIVLVAGSGGSQAAATASTTSDAADLPVTLGQLAQLPMIAAAVAGMGFCIRALSSGRKLQ
jgi:hypothetical protein